MKTVTIGGFPHIVFTPEKLDELKKAHQGALKAGKPVFVFEGRELLVSYAKYLIEYLETVMMNQDDKS